MARPERNNVDYFPHSVKNGKKMSYIEKKYKNDGYAVWFKLLEELGENNYHFLDLSDEVQVMFLEEKCNVSEITLISIIKDLVKLGEFNKVLWEENKVLFNEKFAESIEDAYSKRNNKCITLDSLFSHLISLGVRKQSKSKSTGSIKPQSRVEDSREEKSKVKKSFAEYVFLTDEEHKKLTTEYGKSKTLEMITVLDNYKGSSGKKYKSDYRAILNWVLAKVNAVKINPEETNKRKYNVRSRFNISKEFIAESEEQARDMYCKHYGVTIEDITQCK